MFLRQMFPHYRTLSVIKFYIKLKTQILLHISIYTVIKLISNTLKSLVLLRFLMTNLQSLNLQLSSPAPKAFLSMLQRSLVPSWQVNCSTTHKIKLTLSISMGNMYSFGLWSLQEFNFQTGGVAQLVEYWPSNHGILS
jgi:hypothetical protein